VWSLYHHLQQAGYGLSLRDGRATALCVGGTKGVAAGSILTCLEQCGAETDAPQTAVIDVLDSLFFAYVSEESAASTFRVGGVYTGTRATSGGLTPGHSTPSCAYLTILVHCQLHVID
jgi:hypothetical protein